MVTGNGRWPWMSVVRPPGPGPNALPLQGLEARAGAGMGSLPRARPSRTPAQLRVSWRPTGCSLRDRVSSGCLGLTGETRVASQQLLPGRLRSVTGGPLTPACRPPADLVAGPRADLRQRQTLRLHPRPLRLQPLLLPMLRHACRQVHLLGGRQGPGRRRDRRLEGARSPRGGGAALQGPVAWA